MKAQILAAILLVPLSGCVHQQVASTPTAIPQAAVAAREAENVLRCRVLLHHPEEDEDAWHIHPEGGGDWVGVVLSEMTIPVTEQTLSDSFKRTWEGDPSRSPRIILDVADDPLFMAIGMSRRIELIRRAAVAAGHRSVVRVDVVLPSPEKFPQYYADWPRDPAYK